MAESHSTYADGLELSEAKMMGGVRYWIHQGRLEALLPGQTHRSTDEEELWRNGSVRLTTGHLGTEIKWMVNAPCTASIFTAINWLSSAKGPYILRFLAIGWFEEIYADVSAVIGRLEHVLANGDRHISARVFIREAEAQMLAMPPAVKDAFKHNLIAEEFAVDCSYDNATHTFRVDRIGPKSAIARVWGTHPSSPPCQSAGSYGDPVNATYEEVMRTNRPRYDHVLAALRLPNDTVHWIPYHRIVFPRPVRHDSCGVAVISQIAGVDIRVL